MSLLQLKKVTKYFGGLPAVLNVDLEVEAGEIVGLIGPNGAGKTTLFNVISGYFPPTKGEIYFKGENITGLKMHRVAQKGLVRTFQHSRLFTEMTVLENMVIAFHLYKKPRFWRDLFGGKRSRLLNDELEKEAVELLGLFDLAGIKDKIAGSLPHGHQRLLCLAIAMAARPELFLLDEPVTGMNPEESRLMMSYIKNIQSMGITVLLVEHSMKVVMNVCERICVLSYGQQMAIGEPDVICRDQRVIEAYLGKEYASRDQ